MNELKEYQYLHHPLLRLNQRGWWREQSRPPMLNRASFSQKSEMRLCRKQELINGNRPSSITFPTIMYLPGILSAYMLHFPTQNLESNLRDSVKLTTDPTSSVMKHCDQNNISDYITSLIICTSWLVDTYDILVCWRAAHIKKRIFFFFQNSAFYHYSRDLTDLIS